MYVTLLNFAKSYILSSKCDNIENFHHAVFEL